MAGKNIGEGLSQGNNDSEGYQEDVGRKEGNERHKNDRKK